MTADSWLQTHQDAHVVCKQGIAERLKSRMILAASGQAPDTRPALIFAEVRAQMHRIWETCRALPNVAALLAEVCPGPLKCNARPLEAGGRGGGGGRR